MVKKRFQNKFKMVKFVKTVYYGNIFPKTVEMVKKKFKWSSNFPKLSIKAKNNLKLFQKITAVGVTAV